VLGTGAEIPLQPVEKTVVKQFVFLEPMEVHGGADSQPPCSPQRTPGQSKWMCPEGSCSPWRVHTGAGSWQKLQPAEEPTQKLQPVRAQ